MYRFIQDFDMLDFIRVHRDCIVRSEIRIPNGGAKIVIANAAYGLAPWLFCIFLLESA